ncbi:MAG: ATP-binding protein [Treponema sp.]|nr:ATP-binding protein [Treponema sp.]
MRPFIQRALKKFDKLSSDQLRQLLVSSSREIDRLETLIDTLPRGIILCDTAHKLILANRAGRRLLSLGTTPSREPLWTLLEVGELSHFLEETLLHSDRAEEREFDAIPSESNRLISVSVVPLQQDGRSSGTLIMVDDITERRSREARLHRMESLASLTTLAAGVAHEIKNPLASLSIHVQLIQKILEDRPPKLDPQSKEGISFQRLDNYLGVLNEEIERLNGIVVDFLFAVRPMNTVLRRGDLRALILELVDLVRPELEEAGIKLRLELEDAIGPADFDPALLKQALLNLLTNASAAIQGSPNYDRSGGEISLRVLEAEGELKITVADTGAGISEEHLTKIFEPYFTTKTEGTGLGLTMAFKIIKEHRGEIQVESKLGEGTVFVITLPRPHFGQNLLPYGPVQEPLSIPGRVS